MLSFGLYRCADALGATARSEWPSWHSGTAGHHGLIGLHLKARGLPRCQLKAQDLPKCQLVCV